ncbi:MAG: DUF1211 domain-containing protein [Anaerolineae bacterium]|nr:DUF1211 domain-containing protein [Anaerolineae bacterium]
MTKSATQSTSSAAEKLDGIGLERLIFFSDAVFAIAITLLTLEIRLPAAGDSLSNAALVHDLLSIWPEYLAFIISFLVIGSFWIGHHRKFRYIAFYDHRLLFINLLLLMTIAFIPFPTEVISEYGNRAATIFYALAMIPPCILSVTLWYYAAHNNRLIAHDTDDHVRRREMVKPLAVAGVFVISIGLAFVNSDLAKFSWGLVAVVAIVLK